MQEINKSPDLFSTTTSIKKHQQDHANVNCPECDQLQNETSEDMLTESTKQGTESNPDENFNLDTRDIHTLI